MPLIVPTNRWDQIQRPLFRWVPTIDRILRLQPLEAMHGSLIHVFSDYAGEHKTSAYAVSSVLYMDVAASSKWEMQRQLVRQQYLADGRRLSFKGLNDRQKQMALVPFLEATGEISGLCLVVAVHKSIRNLCSNPEIRSRFSAGLAFSRKWQARSFEKLLQVTHLIGLLIGGLSKPGQDIYWFSDEDQLFENSGAVSDVNMMLNLFSSHYVSHKLGQLGLGTTEIDEGDRFEEDHVSVTDLAAGAVAEMLTTLSAYAGGRFPASGVALPFGGHFSPKTEVIYPWISDSTRRLKKVVVLFEPAHPSGFSVSKLNM